MPGDLHPQYPVHGPKERGELMGPAVYSRALLATVFVAFGLVFAFGGGEGEPEQASLFAGNTGAVRAPSGPSRLANPAALQFGDDLTAAIDPSDPLPRTSLGAYNVVRPETGVRYFVYQPSGGFGNQILCLRSAVTLALQFDRVLVIPMTGRHSYGPQYFELRPPSLLETDRVLDVGGLVQSSELKGAVVLSVPLRDFLRNITARYGKSSVVKYSYKNENKYGIARKKKDLERLARDGLLPDGGDRSFLFYGNKTMYNSGLKRWDGKIGYGVGIRRFAAQLAAPLGQFHATHVRLGDYKSRFVPFTKSQVAELFEKWVEHPSKATSFNFEPLRFQTMTSVRSDIQPPYPAGVARLYVATELESSRRHFEPLCTRATLKNRDSRNFSAPDSHLESREKAPKFDCVWSENLDPALLDVWRTYFMELLHSEFDAEERDVKYRRKLSKDVMGLVEAHICASAVFFAPKQHFSSFSLLIRRMRMSLEERVGN